MSNEPRTKRVHPTTVRPDAELYEQLMIFAEGSERTLNGAMIYLMRKGLEAERGVATVANESDVHLRSAR